MARSRAPTHRHRPPPNRARPALWLCSTDSASLRIRIRPPPRGTAASAKRARPHDQLRQYCAHLWMVSVICGNRALTESLINS
eukprot:4884735-Prymnesium_polylepis.1